MNQLMVLYFIASLFFSGPVLGQSKKKLQKYFHQAFDSINAHVGICIYDPATGQYWLRHNDEQYFTPASNTKICTLYAGLSFLGDSLPGLKYTVQEGRLYIQGTGDPSFLHPDYQTQPVYDFLQRARWPIVFTSPVYENDPYGPGWAWSDYNDSYQPERSAFPIYGNVVRCWVKKGNLQVVPSYFVKQQLFKEDPRLVTSSFFVQRAYHENEFHYAVRVDNDNNVQEIPFLVQEDRLNAALLADTLHRPVTWADTVTSLHNADLLRSIPADSLFRPMMHRSDNFYAEQVLQMCSAVLFDTISTAKMINYLLQNKLNDLPQPPKWVDGSGLSRYNLFSPRDMVFVLKKLRDEFPEARLFQLFPTAGSGTLRSLYKGQQNFIFAKTGSLSNNSALSGYLITQKGKTLIFSILCNNYVIPHTQVRKAVEKLLRAIREKY